MKLHSLLVLRSKLVLTILPAAAAAFFLEDHLCIPNPESKIIFAYYPETDRGLDCHVCRFNPLICRPHLPGMCGVVSCSGEVCFPMECCKHYLKVHILLVVLIPNMLSSLSCLHTQYQTVSQVSCLDRFYILLAWQGQKDGGFSSLFCGAQSNSQAQLSILPGKMLCHRDL